MKLYIRLGSLRKFQDLYDSNEYLQKVLESDGCNVYKIKTDDYTEIRRLLNSRNIKFEISDK